MSVPFLATRALSVLRSSIAANQSAYIEGRASSLLTAMGPGTVHQSSSIHAGLPPALAMPEGDNKRDAENIRSIHRWLGHLTPLQASDPRLWVCLTHSCYADYTFQRWPVDSESKVVDRIRDRYFMDGEGLSSITRNSVARLWWFGHLALEPARPDPYELVDVLVSVQDMQQAFLERTLGRSRRVLHTALRLWKQRVDDKGPPPNQGAVIQRWARLIRLHGAVSMLDTIPDSDLKGLIWVKLAAALNEELPELDAEDKLS